MESIVKELTKIDLHIHSNCSSEKDGNLVRGGTKENISAVLVPMLESNGINMAALTDHNSFSYEYYCEFRQCCESTTNLKRVLPGIELDIDVEDSGTDTHAIAIFDDSNEEKVRAIESIVEGEKRKAIQQHKANAETLKFSQTEVIDLFRKIGLNFVLIVHQKCDPSSSKGQTNNAAAHGVERFNELVSYDYFDSVEFKNYKVEGFLRAHKAKYGVEFNSLCGSDCHVWEKYPKHDEEDKTVFHPCFIKSLPTFKGLAMALTGDNRIVFAHRDLRKPYLDKIEFDIRGTHYSISLSSGLNVIIGDNSIGKSFLLECLVNPTLNDIGPKYKDKIRGYKSFKKGIDFKITSNTLDQNTDSFEFCRQGYIRSLFEGEQKSIEDQPFLKDYFSEIDVGAQKNLIAKIVNDFVQYEKTISDYHDSEGKLRSGNIVLNHELCGSTYHLNLVVDLNTLKVNDFAKILSSIENILGEMRTLSSFSLLQSKDKEYVDEMLQGLVTMKSKYQHLQQKEQLRARQYSFVVAAMEAKKKEIEKKSTDLDRNRSSYSDRKKEFVQLMCSHWTNSYRFKKNTFDFSENVPIVIEKTKKSHGMYTFVSQAKSSCIKSQDIENMLLSPVSRCDVFNDLKQMGWTKIAERLNSDTKKLDGTSEIDKYKTACMNYAVSNWLEKQRGSIITDTRSFVTGNSAGLNAQYYLDLRTLLERKSLFIIDQPEDDVSEIRISSELKDTMRRMGDREQLLFVTHNAELVVNLDVDNVIVLKNDEQGSLRIFNGALEYEDKANSINILGEVADLLDGGAEVIRRRWKRYEKN